MPSLAKIRDVKFWQQGSVCYYCQQPMWLRDFSVFAKTYGLTLSQARHFQATAEHLLARCDGGTDSSENIVAACLYCNRHRHAAQVALSPALYKKKVGFRLRSGKWHKFVARREALL
ncbi:HNH endonuclease [Sphingomonas sp. MM-1]|uniref:HNH endonuclease n=1 Tax=Sphingomonas sp. MM-1 TaxID=745310 RepID=UPI0002C0727E|nr:HNH endonuclease [Sphingomonas sp. MM-1]AGH49033.1 HNH endonuclease [Sphingomonas sp. MM-1]